MGEENRGSDKHYPHLVGARPTTVNVGEVVICENDQRFKIIGDRRDGKRVLVLVGLYDDESYGTIETDAGYSATWTLEMKIKEIIPAKRVHTIISY
jgi:hypothetical protein